MKSEKTIKGTIRLLKRHYWGNIFILVLLLLLILYGELPFLSSIKNVSVTLERYDIVLLIIAIPLSLKYFADKMKKAPRPVETTNAIQIYKKASYLRLYTFNILSLVQIVLYGYSRNMNFFWLTIVLFTVFLFCKPSQVELTEMTEKPDEGNSEEQDLGKEDADEVPEEDEVPYGDDTGEDV